jgi:hypothetical protein
MNNMGLNYLNLDDITRKLMINELEIDVEKNNVYLSNRLSATGRARYILTLKDSFESSNDSSLAAQIRQGYLNPTEQRKTKNGYTTAKVPITAADTLAEGEFNRYYIRGLCRRIIENETGKLVVYRAKSVNNPRPESEMMIGKTIDPRTLLADLRTHTGVDTVLGLPAGPNSGLSLKIIDDQTIKDTVS